jgi:hypothetical protein
MAKPIDNEGQHIEVPESLWHVKRPSEERIRRLAALAAWHDEWVDRKLAEAPFNPESRPDGSDYNLHYVDLEADDDEFHQRARAILDGTADLTPPPEDS